MENQKLKRKPDWLKIKVPIGKEYTGVKDVVKKNKPVRIYMFNVFMYSFCISH